MRDRKKEVLQIKASCWVFPVGKRNNSIRLTLISAPYRNTYIFPIMLVCLENMSDRIRSEKMQRRNETRRTGQKMSQRALGFVVNPEHSKGS